MKQIGQYDNTLILFTSDNTGSGPVQFPLAGIFSNAVDYEQFPAFIRSLNNTLSNLGNSSSNVNYGAWGSYLSVAPLSGFKTSPYEGGTRPPFVIKEPSTMVSPLKKKPTNHIINSFVFVTDITPTLLDYANVPQPGLMYKGHQIHSIMGKSFKPLIEGTVDRIHGVNEPIGSELFNKSSIYMGDWKAVNAGKQSEYKWDLYNIVKDPAENNNMADKYPLLQKMIIAYQKYSKDVGVVIPRGSLFVFLSDHIFPSFDDIQTVKMDYILPNSLEVAKALVKLWILSEDT